MQQLFETLFVVGNPNKIFQGKNLFNESLNCHILKTEGRRKRKFSEVDLQICKKIEWNPSKKIST